MAPATDGPHSPLRISVIVNPVAGLAGGGRPRGRRRAEAALDLLRAEGVEPEVLVSARHGHARELAQDAVARGARIVVAWGGDGTVNEVAGALAFGAASLGIVPAGSGNGLARTLGLPTDPAGAIRRIVGGEDRRIDVGEAAGRLFVNIAGLGFDAHVATELARLGRARRGFLRYAAIVLRELGAYEAIPYRLVLDGRDAGAEPAFLLAFANGRQWGNGAVIAPSARLDDGRLDVVRVAPRGRAALLAAIPRLFLGTIGGARGVQFWTTADATVTARAPLVCHADGEPIAAGPSLRVRVHPAALGVRA